jgi:hypothetical protein
MRRGMVRSLTALAVLLPGLAFAQSPSGTATPAPSVARPTTVISVNPFLPLAGYFQGEFERRVQDNLAFAVGASHVEYDERTTNIDAKLRFYPQEKALSGLGLAAGLGVGFLRQTTYNEVTCLAIGCPVPGSTVNTTVAPAISIEAHYQWLLGRSRNTAVGFGFGGKRYLASGTFPEFVPTGRLTIGYAFGR